MAYVIPFNRRYQLTVAKPIIKTEKHLEPPSRIARALPASIEVDFNTTPSDGYSIDDLQIVAQINQKTKSQTTDAKFSIYNLSKETRAKFEEADAFIQLKADYGFRNPDELPVLFFGQVVESFSERAKDGEWVTELTCKDASSSIRNTLATVGFPKGTTHKEVVETLVSYLEGISLGTIYMGGNEGLELKTQYTECGKVIDILSDFCRQYRYEYFIVNHVISIITETFVTLKTPTGDGLEEPSPDAEKAIKGLGFVVRPENVIELKRQRSSSGKSSQSKSNKIYYFLKIPLEPRLSLSNMGVKLEGFDKEEHEVGNGFFALEDIKHSLNYENGEWVTEIKMYK